jgi:hypothetical protein
MVRAQTAAAYPQENTGWAAQADRAGHARGVHAVVDALAAGRTTLAVERGGGGAGGAAPTGGLRSAGDRMGADAPAATCCRLRSALAGCLMPGGCRGVGTHLPSPGFCHSWHRFFGSQTSGAHQHGSCDVLSARGRTLDGSLPGRTRDSRAGLTSLLERAGLAGALPATWCGCLAFRRTK